MDSFEKKIKLLRQLKEKLIVFLDELIELLPNHSQDLVNLRIHFLDSIPMETVMDIMIERMLPNKSMIEQRKDVFFLEQNDIFSGLSDDGVSYFRTIWTSKELDDDDKAAIWDWFIFFLKLTEAYKKLG